MNTFPRLRNVEEKDHGVLAVLGIHSAEFRAERARVGLRDVVRRYVLQHSVVNDAQFQTRSACAVRARPPLFLLFPLGKFISKHEGELFYGSIDALRHVPSP